MACQRAGDALKAQQGAKRAEHLPGAYLDAPAGMQRGDPAGEIAVADLRQPGRRHHRAELLLRRKAADRLGEVDRSEEHTSELQSLMRISYAVFCLKKKNN